MSVKSIIASPTPFVREQGQGQKEKRIANGKCEAHIYADTSVWGTLPINYTTKWRIDVTDNSGNTVGHFDGTNPEGIRIGMGTEYQLWIDGQPNLQTADVAGTKNWALTIQYGLNGQNFNSQSCYRYLDKAARESNVGNMGIWLGAVAVAELSSHSLSGVR
ncbi:Uu.00g067170.m01.CDS01 [Anthostomella pinea]|uniref:Uu.00g067170.m01.CDS01 n=1 Tax=Anthostomella pinea TaxID=933095 RepID=A0AAI8VU25_9PEZI|nr:Uu.00g067170.m01.CDS01 [Anthostomella pinea]